METISIQYLVGFPFTSFRENIKTLDFHQKNANFNSITKILHKKVILTPL